jgi:YHS domain-containing protein
MSPDFYNTATKFSQNIMNVKGIVYLLAIGSALTAFAQPALRGTHFNVDHGVAIEGYDPVAYFSGKAIEGKKDLSYKHEGITYYFSSPANRELFVKSPASYEPQYGGWCAYAMGASGEKVEVDPETFKVVDGKLFLFYNSLFNNTLPKWNSAEAQLKMKADDNWRVLFK